jgi:hypothetical protein
MVIHIKNRLIKIFITNQFFLMKVTTTYLSLIQRNDEQIVIKQGADFTSIINKLVLWTKQFPSSHGDYNVIIDLQNNMEYINQILDKCANVRWINPDTYVSQEVCEIVIDSILDCHTDFNDDVYKAASLVVESLETIATHV